MYRDLSYMKIALPEDVVKLKAYGDYEGARKLIRHLFTKNLTKAMHKRLEMELDILDVLENGQYPYTWDEALKIMQENIRDFKEEELTVLKETSAADWIYRNGEVHFQRRFYQNLIKTRPDLEKRLIHQEEEESKEGMERKKLLIDNMRYMKEHGGRTARIRIRAAIKPVKEAERPGNRVKVHLPIPKNCIQNSHIEILAHTKADKVAIAPEEAEQRTICMETILEPDQEFMVEYAYDCHVDYVELDPAKASSTQPDFFLEERLPHIMFTPYLRELQKEVVGGEKNPVKAARRIYDYVTTHIMYSYMREYFTIPCAAEYAAVNLKGDCGVQALLFITLCRLSGIPARWQSGLYVTKYSVGNHDWAQFYIAPYGWVFADCSFGGSAWRLGETERWDYYFGNLDVFRMAANSEIQSEFEPPKNHLRIDPVDNQRGEMEYEDQGLSFQQVEFSQRLISIEDI